MEQLIKFDGNITNSYLEQYPDDEFCVVELDFIGTNENSHHLYFSDEVLRKYADTILGKWIVADTTPIVDCDSHTEAEHIVGKVPTNQSIKFVEKDGYTRATCFGVISKVYAKDFCQMFNEQNTNKSVSIEFKAITANNDSMNDTIIEFKIFGVTVLGNKYNPSSPGSNIDFIRFSEQDADEYFNNTHLENSALQKYVKEQMTKMEETNYVNHPIDTSKKAMYEGEWDGDKAKHDLIKEKNYSTLAKKVCLRLEAGWEDREVSKLGYPVMMLHEGKWVYSRKGLASAMAYAKQHGDNDVIAKLNSLYKKLDLDSKEKEETKMEELKEFEEIQEELSENETEDSVEVECVEETEEKETEDSENEEESEEEKEDFEAKCAELSALLVDKEHIIMEQETELAELRKFKESIEETQKTEMVNQVLAKIKEFVSNEQYGAFVKESEAIKFAEINTWKNGVMAQIGEVMLDKANTDGFRMSFAQVETKPTNVWDRI